MPFKVLNPNLLFTKIQTNYFKRLIETATRHLICVTCKHVHHILTRKTCHLEFVSKLSSAVFKIINPKSLFT